MSILIYVLCVIFAFLVQILICIVQFCLTFAQCYFHLFEVCDLLIELDQLLFSLPLLFLSFDYRLEFLDFFLSEG